MPVKICGRCGDEKNIPEKRWFCAKCEHKGAKIVFGKWYPLTRKENKQSKFEVNEYTGELVYNGVSKL